MMYKQLVIAVVVLLASCAPNLEETCCEQCLAAAAQDPAGMDISNKDCRGYGFKVDQTCLTYFTQSITKVQDCRLRTP